MLLHKILHKADNYLLSNIFKLKNASFFLKFSPFNGKVHIEIPQIFEKKCKSSLQTSTQNFKKGALKITRVI